MMRAPMSRMDILTDAELEALISNSKLAKKYNKDIDRESAYEMLNEKIDKAEAEAEKERLKKEKEKKKKAASKKKTSRKRSSRQNPILKVLTSATFIRGVFQILKKIR